MDDDYPEALQIEVTNRCNFNCQMCIRQVWKVQLQDLNFDLYKKVAESSFHRLERLILYGFGEPLIHPNFTKMLRVARKNLPKECPIIISTNGSLLTPSLAEKMFRESAVDSISFSIDTLNVARFSRLRKGSKPTGIMKNFRKLAEMKGKLGDALELGVEVVVMNYNFTDLPNLVRSLAEQNVDRITVSHVVPYTEEIFANAVYMMLSKPSFDIIKPSLQYGWSLISEATRETFGRAYGVNIERKSAEILINLWRKAENAGYWINLPLLFKSKDRIELMDRVEEKFHESLKIAHNHQVDLKLPNLFPDAKNRSCPYVDKNIMAVRSDGAVVPCLEFMYSHVVYVNMHSKKVDAVSFGDLHTEGVEKIWNRKEYMKFRDVRRNFAKNMPWCGDCPYSTLKCFFTETNQHDCYANAPSCSECLYSANLAQCNI